MSDLQHTQQTAATPIVSFVITYYNLPIPMLCECINSILRLSLRQWEREIIVVDDGSDVSPMNGLMQYGEEIVYVRQRNGGLSDARNRGISMATGTYIQFIDADDYLLQTSYEHCLDIVRYHADADMVLFELTNSPKALTNYEDSRPVSGTEYMRHCNIHGTTCGYLFKRSVLGELRFTPHIYHEDEEFTPQLLLRSERVYPTMAHAYYYRRRSGSITTKADPISLAKRLDDIKGVVCRLHSLCGRLPQNDRLAMQRRVAQLTMDYLYNIIVLTRSRRVLDCRIEELRAEGLFPLPARDYSQKYVWFRRMTNSGMGRTILLHTLPLLGKER